MYKCIKELYENLKYYKRMNYVYFIVLYFCKQLFDQKTQSNQ